MAVITLPPEVEDSIGGMTIGQARFDVPDVSATTGAAQTNAGAPPRWLMRMRSKRGMDLALAGQWQAVMLKLRGGINHLAVYDRLRAVPVGTARGQGVVTSALSSVGSTTAALTAVRSAPNLLLAPSQFDAGVWSNSATVTANTHLAPDGTMTADTVTDASTAVGQVLLQSVPVLDDASPYEFSVHVRKTSGGTANTFGLGCDFSGGATAAALTARINTDLGIVLFGGSAVVVIDADAFWRVVIQLANNSSGHTAARLVVWPAIAAPDSVPLDVTRTGSAVVWGAQISQVLGAAYAGDPSFVAGDWLQIGTGVGSHLAQVVESVTLPGGAGTVQFEPPTRQAYPSGSAVTIEKALGHYKMTGDSIAWTAGSNGPTVEGFDFDGREQW